MHRLPHGSLSSLLLLIPLLLGHPKAPCHAQVQLSLSEIDLALDSLQRTIEWQEAALTDFIRAYTLLDARGAVREGRAPHSADVDLSPGMARYSAARLLTLPHPYQASSFLATESPFDPPVVLAEGRFVGRTVAELLRLYDAMVDFIPGTLAEIRRLDQERLDLEAERSWRLGGTEPPRTEGPVTGYGRRPDVDSLVAEGYQVLDAGDLQGARAVFDRALQLEDQHAGAHLGRGRVFYGLNQNQASVVEMDQAVLLAPEWGLAWAWRGWVRYSRLGLADMGIQDFQSGCERRDAWACRSMRDAAQGVMEAGLSAYQMEDYTSALAHFERAVGIDPTYPDGWYNRGLTRLALNDLSGGIEDLQAFLRHTENYANYARARPLPPIQVDQEGVAEAWARVGIAQYQLRQYDQALQSLAQAGFVAGQANPSAIPRYQFWAGRVLEAQGDRERAYEMYRQACGGGEHEACADRDRLGGRHP